MIVGFGIVIGVVTASVLFRAASSDHRQMRTTQMMSYELDAKDPTLFTGVSR